MTDPKFEPPLPTQIAGPGVPHQAGGVPEARSPLEHKLPQAITAQQSAARATMGEPLPGTGGVHQNFPGGPLDPSRKARPSTSRISACPRNTHRRAFRREMKFAAAEGAAASSLLCRLAAALLGL
jgi:hypothetical protein